MRNALPDGVFFFSSRRRHTRLTCDWIQTCALPISRPFSLIFSQICDNLKENGLVTKNSRVVLEKPLGRDLASAKQINAEVGKVFEESQIYRIDHRSEERRVGKECRARWEQSSVKKK